MITDVAFDLDGTLVDTHTVFYDELEKSTGVKVDKRKITQFHIDSVYPEIPRDDVVKAIYRGYKRWKEVELKPGAVELMQELWNITQDPVRIITARPWRYYEDTYKLVDRIFMGTPFILITVGMVGSKLAYLKNIRNFVEDRRETAIKLANAGKRIYLLDYPYNRKNCKHSMIKRISSLEYLVDSVETLVKIGG